MTRQHFRKLVLREIGRRADGDLATLVSSEDVAQSLKTSREDVEKAMKLMAGFGWLIVVEPGYDPFLVVRITKDGILEAEKMEEHPLKRLFDEHPIFVLVVNSVVTSMITSTFTLLVAGLIFWFGWKR